MEKKKRVLMTYIESGMGHITSIRSISDNFKRFYGDKFEILDEYIMQTDKNLKSWEKFIIKQTKNTNRIRGFGNFIFWFLNFMGGVKFMRFLHRTVFAGHTRHCLKAFAKYKPDVIVSTHYFLTFAALEYRKKVNPNCKVVTYNPDNNVHVWWDNREHLFLVNNESAFYEAVGEKKFNPAMVSKVSFIARDQILNANKTREEYREKSNLPKDQFCVVVADGVYACGKAKKVVKILLKTDKPLTVILVAGKNEKLLKKYQTKIEKGQIKKNIHFVVLPFMPNVYEYYKAADVFVTKAGPNAVLDSVFMGTPVLIDLYAHPIEKATTKLFVEDLKVGKVIFKPKKILAQIEKWTQDKSELLTFEQNCKKIDKFENGGKLAADIIFDYVEKPQISEFESNYKNCLYELALQEKFDALTTPFNVNTKNEKVDYDKILHTSFGEKILRVIVKGIVATFGPLVNFFGFGLKVVGRKNLKSVKSAVVVCNHVHYVDSLWNLRVLKGKKVYITAAPHNWKKGFGGKILKAGGMIPLPATYSQNKEFLSVMRKLLEKPALVQFCSEQGLWLRYEQSRPFKKTAFMYASENNVPVVPIVYVFKKSKLRRKKKVIAYVGKPIYPEENLSKQQASTFLQQQAQKFYDETVISFYGYDPKTYAMNKINKKKDA